MYSIQFNDHDCLSMLSFWTTLQHYKHHDMTSLSHIQRRRGDNGTARFAMKFDRQSSAIMVLNQAWWKKISSHLVELMLHGINKPFLQDAKHLLVFVNVRMDKRKDLFPCMKMLHCDFSCLLQLSLVIICLSQRKDGIYKKKSKRSAEMFWSTFCIAM